MSQQQIEIEIEQKRVAMRIAAEWGYKAAERGDNIEKMRADFEELMGTADRTNAKVLV